MFAPLPTLCAPPCAPGNSCIDIFDQACSAQTKPPRRLHPFVIHLCCQRRHIHRLQRQISCSSLSKNCDAQHAGFKRHRLGTGRQKQAYRIHPNQINRGQHLIANTFSDFEPEPETPEEVVADWADIELPDDSFLGTDAIDEVTETLFTEDLTPEYFVQNAVALALVTVFLVSFAFILFRLVVVVYSLVAAAFRYTVVAIFVLVLFVLFT